jgi:hypothetical protein
MLNREVRLRDPTAADRLDALAGVRAAADAARESR